MGKSLPKMGKILFRGKYKGSKDSKLSTPHIPVKTNGKPSRGLKNDFGVYYTGF